MSSQIFLFTGENDYALVKEKNHWVSEFVKNHGDENLLIIDKKAFSFSKICDEVAAAPFIAEKRLVLLRGIPSMDKDQWQTIVDSMHPSTVLLIIEPKPDKRLSVTKAILKVANIKEFTPLSSAQLSAWTQGQMTISTEMAQYIVSTIGQNQMQLSHEITKLQTYNGDITKDVIDGLTVLSSTQAVWLLMDLLAAGDTKKTLQFIRKTLDTGESAHGLWARFLWMIAQIPPVCSAVWKGETNPAVICKLAGVNFPTAKTLIPLARRLHPQKLKEIITLCTEFDTQLKTGGYKATKESPEELEAIIDTCVCTVMQS